MTGNAVPEGHTGITPYLVVDDGKGAIEFYERAFGATPRGVMNTTDGKVAHAELVIGDAVLMLCDKLPQFVAETPTVLGGTTVEIHLYVEDVDAVVHAAAKAGAEVLRQPENQFYGDRLGVISDPYGHVWLVATRVETLSPEEVDARAKELFASVS
jgi:PhnB protein